MTQGREIVLFAKGAPPAGRRVWTKQGQPGYGRPVVKHERTETVSINKGVPATFGQIMKAKEASSEVTTALLELAKTIEGAIGLPEDPRLTDELRMRAVVVDNDVLLEKVAKAIRGRRSLVQKEADDRSLAEAIL